MPQWTHIKEVVTSMRIVIGDTQELDVTMGVNQGHVEPLFVP